MGNAPGRIIILCKAPSEGYRVCGVAGGGVAQLDALASLFYTS